MRGGGWEEVELEQVILVIEAVAVEHGVLGLYNSMPTPSWHWANCHLLFQHSSYGLTW